MGRVFDILDESGSNVFRYALRKEGLQEILHAIIWETLQCRGSRIPAASGKEIGGEIHKSRIEERIGEEGWEGAIKRPNWQLSD